MANKLDAPRISMGPKGIYSADYGDIYFNSKDPEGEVNWVFITPNSLISRWDKLLDGEQFVIAETGFGSGLNFFVTLNHWLNIRSSKRQRYLRYISFEKYPIPIEKLIGYYRDYFPAHAECLKQISCYYPPLIEGVHLIRLPRWGVELYLVWGDAVSMMDQLSFTADAWFLDGFAPAVNPEMWQLGIFSSVANHSKNGTTLATFTSAGKVRRGLLSVGFELKKELGFGGKREMLVGLFQEAEKAEDSSSAEKGELKTTVGYQALREPWYFPPAPKTQVSPKIAVIGAGLAGTAIAERLVHSGADVTLYDAFETVASGASGNDLGVLFFRPGIDNSAHNRLFERAYCRSLQELHELGPPVFVNSGVLQLAYSDKECEQQFKVKKLDCWDSNWLCFMDADSASRKAGLELGSGGMFFPKSGYFKPRLWSQTRVEKIQHVFPQRFNLRLNTKVLSIRREVSGANNHDAWYLMCQTALEANGEGNGVFEEGPFEHVILASGVSVNELLKDIRFPIRSIRGQVTHLKPVGGFSPETVVCYNGYITPRVEVSSGLISHIGATFNPRSQVKEVQGEDHLINIEKLICALKRGSQCDQGLRNKLLAAVFDGRVGHRAQLPDYLPIVGPVPNRMFYEEAYEQLRYGRLKCQYPRAEYLNGLWVCAGFGAKGGTLSTLMADILDYYIMGAPAPIEQDIIRSLHPARFLIRGIKRRSN